MRPASGAAFLARLRAQLDATPEGRATAVAVVIVALAGRAGRSDRAVGRAAASLRSDDVLALLSPRVVIASAPVRPGSGPETFRDRVARALLTGAPPEERRRRSIVALVDRADAARAEERIGLALDELLARPRRRPSHPSWRRRSAAAPVVVGPEPTLRERTVRGGSYLVAREGMGMVVRLAGVVLTVRAIGPAGYGIYSAAAAFVAVVTVVAQMGIETYLIRQPGELDRRRVDVAFTFLLLSSAVLTAGGFGATFLVGGLLQPHGVVGPLRVLLLSVPLNALWAPAQAMIERQFRYRAMGLLELGGDAVLYATAIPLALSHEGPWSLVVGFLAMQGWLLVGSYAVSGLRPRVRWSGAIVRDLLRHGRTYSLSVWADELRRVVSPLIVGPVAGATGVGYVAFADRLVSTVGFARRGAYRLGMAAMARVPSGHRARLRAAIEEGTVLQFVALALPFALFGLLARPLVPVLFGPAWDQALPLYAVMSVAAMLGAAPLVQSTFLLSRGRNLQVAAFTATATGLLALGTFLSVRQLGLIGYGIGCLASLGSLWVVDRAVRREVHFGYGRIAAAAAVTVPVALAPLVPAPAVPLLVVPLGVGLLVRPFRVEAVRLYDVVRSSIGRPRKPAPQAVAPGRPGAGRVRVPAS